LKCCESAGVKNALWFLGGGGTIARPVVRKESVASIAIHAKLVDLAVLREFFLHARGMGWRGVRVSLAKQRQQRTGHGGHHINRGHGALWRMLILDDEAASGIYRGIEIAALTSQDKRIPSPGAETDGADFAIGIRLALEIGNGPFEVRHRLRVWHRKHGL